MKWICTTPRDAWQEREIASRTPAGRADLEWDGSTGQTWEGFGGCFNELGWHALSGLDDNQRESVLGSLFSDQGCRLSMCRVPIGASDYALKWYSHNETPEDFAMENFSLARDREYLIPYIKAAQKYRPDVRLFASPWSPPTWMKHPAVCNHGRIIWEPRYLEAYALYFARFVTGYAAEGIPVVQVHPQNEPVADQKFPSCVVSGEQFREFIGEYLGPTFKEQGVDTEIWLGTLNTPRYNEYPLRVLSDPKCAELVAGVGFQWAGKLIVGRTRAAWPHKKVMQTENECGNGKNTWEYAHYVFDLFQHYITSGVSSYCYWNMVLQPGGMSSWGWHQNAMVTVDGNAGTVTYNPEYFVMKHFSRFVDKGAVRLGLSGPLSGNAVAFRNSNGERVLVVNNPLDSELTVNVRFDEAAGRVALPPESFSTILV